MRRCLVCSREPQSGGLCALHKLAKDKLTDSYRLWNLAYGSIDYKSYLQTLIELPETGEAVIEVAKMLISRGGEDFEDDDNMREA
ncbi:MAG: hypothetical protein ACUVTM_00720 [Candidatus Bathyarchaeia archaeon]